MGTEDKKSFFEEITDLLVLLDNVAQTHLSQQSPKFDLKSTRKEAEDFISRFSGEIFGAKEDGKLLGVLFGEERLDCWHVKYIVVAEGFWRRGIGTKLLEFTEQEVRRTSSKNRITLDCLSNNRAAVDAYLSNGFFINCYSMVKFL
jgi:GNAT superfamily N-acetyltransferase